MQKKFTLQLGGEKVKENLLDSIKWKTKSIQIKADSIQS